MNTDVTAVFAPAKKAAEGDEKATGADMAGIQVSHSARVSATGHISMRHVRKAKAGREPGLANGVSFVVSNFGQWHFRHRPALRLRSRCRAAFCFRLWRRQLLRLGRHRTIEELEAELVAVLLVFVDDNAHVAARLQMAEQDFIGQRLLDVLLDNTRHRTGAHQLVVAIGNQPARGLLR